MESETTLQHVLREDVNAQLVRLDMFLHLLDRIFQASAPYASSAQLTLLVASILKLQQSGRAVKLLAEEELIEEILAIGRTLVEVTVNVCYLQCANPHELQRFLAFHPEAQYRYAGMMQASAARSSAKGLMRRVGDVLSSFRAPTRSHTAEPDWTHRSLAQRAQISDEGTKIPVMSLLLSRCYPRGDAAVHGTMGSLDSFVETLRSQRMPVRQDRYKELSEALFGVNLTLMSFSLFLDEYFDLGMHEAIDQISAADSATRPGLEGQ